MKRLAYIVTCFLTLVLFAFAKNKPAISMQHAHNQFEHQFLSKDLSGSTNYTSIDLIDFDDELYTEDIDETDNSKQSSDHFAIPEFADVISFLFNHQSFKSAVCTKVSQHTAHTPAIPLYILFHSMIIPSGK